MDLEVGDCDICCTASRWVGSVNSLYYYNSLPPYMTTIQSGIWAPWVQYLQNNIYTKSSYFFYLYVLVFINIQNFWKVLTNIMKKIKWKKFLILRLIANAQIYKKTRIKRSALFCVIEETSQHLLHVESGWVVTLSPTVFVPFRPRTHPCFQR